ncbi:MAG: triple tyrosine motif-containing protein, partial [[Clostridium] leptum]
MKAIKRIIASVFVCMFAVTGGLNALALTPTEDSSTVVSQPVSEGISSETSSQTGSVSSGLSSRADDSGLKNESSSSRTPEASSVVDSENSQSSSEPASSGNNSTSLSASAGMPSAEISSSTEAKQAATTVDVSYKTHVQTFGWQDWAANGASAGTTGLAKRLEAIQIKTSAPASQGGIRYRTHVQTYGWLDWVSDGASSGTTGEAKRLEAIQIELTGALATQYDVYYRVHAQTFGWLDWACNGASAGSAGYAKRLEAIQIVLVPKGGKAPGSTAAPYKELPPAVSYQSYLSGAWQNSVLDNAVSGTVGQAKQIEGIKISLQDKAVSFAGSSIQYRTYLQTYAWQDWTSNGGTSGKPGSGKRVEAVQIKLTGSIASSYDVYYRVHSQTFGWLDWACNGQSAGSAGYAKRIEAIQIVLVKKGGAAPGSTATPYKEAPPSVTYQTYISGGWQPTVADKATSGLAGQGKKTEGLRVSLKAGAQSLGNSSVKYRTYLQTYGWQSWVSNGASSAKAGSGKRMEAIEISLTGDISSQYDIYYRSYVTGYGWLGWACNGATSGTTDYAKPIEAVQAVLVKKGGAAPGSTSNAYLKPEVTGPFEISFSPSGASNFGGLVSIEPDHDVILVASAKGGAGGYQYRYRAELIGGSIQTLKDYSGSSSYTWRPNTPGQYKMYVDVKDSTGTVKTAMFQMSVGLSGIDVS